MTEDYEEWLSLQEVAELDWCDASPKQLQEWSYRRESTRFPEPMYIQGKYTFYDPDTVKKWLFFHRKATRNMRLRVVK